VIRSVFDLVVVLVLGAFVGYEVISKVPSILHTPLMSGSNAIHGVILAGAMAIAGEARGPLQETLAFVAVVLATLNVVGGFVVTDRMLGMFRSERRGPAADRPTWASGGAAGEPGAAGARAGERGAAPG
jgi:NAD(P) transhydrogenase subunit alpha